MRRQWWKPFLFTIGGIAALVIVAVLIYGVGLGIANGFTSFRGTTEEMTREDWYVCGGIFFALMLLSRLSDIESAIRAGRKESFEEIRRQERLIEALYGIRNEMREQRMSNERTRGVR